MSAAASGDIEPFLYWVVAMLLWRSGERVLACMSGFISVVQMLVVAERMWRFFSAS